MSHNRGLVVGPGLEQPAPQRTIRVPAGSFYQGDDATKVAQCCACSRWVTNYLVMDAGPAPGIDLSARRGLFLCNADVNRYSEWMQTQLDLGAYVGKPYTEFFPLLFRWLKEKMGRTIE